MHKPTIFVTRRIPDSGLNLLSASCDLKIWPNDLPPSDEELIRQCDSVAAILCLLTDRIDARVMDAAGPSLKVISQYAVGFDNIDVAEATRRGIPVGNTPNALTGATADYAWALLMAAARRVVEADRNARAGQWKTWGPKTLLGPDISGATLGIVGFGRIGQAVARRALGFDMQVLYCGHAPKPQAETDCRARFVSFEEILEKSDFLSLHTPLNAETRGLFGPDQFKAMKRSAILINTARGAVVDQTALYEALRTGIIAAAAIDVTVPEPLPLENPLYQLENLIISPHIASGSIQARDKMAHMAAENLLAGLRGERLPNCVNPVVYNT